MSTEQSPEETRLLLDFSMSALASCKNRLQYTMGLLSGVPFQGEVPSALENVKIVGLACSRYEAFSGQQPTPAQPLTNELHNAAIALEHARQALLRAGWHEDATMKHFHLTVEMLKSTARATEKLHGKSA